MTRRARATTGGVTLLAALAALAVALALSAGIAEVTRTEVSLARSRRATAAALAAADGCLARGLAGLPPGWSFDEALAGTDGVGGTMDDGLLTLPPGCSGRAEATPAPAAGPAARPRLLVTVEGRADGGRRVVQALLGRSPGPGLPALAWLGELPPTGVITGALVLDGADRTDASAPPWAGLAAPADPATLDAWLTAEAARTTRTAVTQAPFSGAPPPVTALAARLQAAGPAGAEVLVASGIPTPARAFVATDLVVPGSLEGAGLLVVGGSLDIRGALHFTGVVVAMGGVRIAAGASLVVDGALWIGAPSVPGSSLRVDGRLELRQDRVAMATADGLVPLPRVAVLLGLRDLG